MSIQNLYTASKFLNFNLPCMDVRSMQTLTANRDSSHDHRLSYVICSFGDGRILSMSLDHQMATKLSNL